MSRRRSLGAFVVLAIGVGTLTIRAAYATNGDWGYWPFVLGIVLPAGLSLVLVLTGVWMLPTGRKRHGRRIAAWCLAGLVGFGAAGVIVISYQRAEGASLVRSGLVVLNTATGGAIVGVLLGIYDADRKRTERRLMDEREKANRLSRRLTVLNRVLRHDIRNDVNVIKGLAHTLREDPDDVPSRAAVIEDRASEMHDLSETARRIERLVERDETGGSIDLVSEIEDRVREFRNRHPEADIEIEGSGDARAPASGLIDIAIDNLLENALEHSDRDEPRVRVTVERRERAGVLEVRIADDGPGIPDHEIAVLQRGHETPLEHTSGLGLWIVNWIVDELDGTIEFEENDPRGTVAVLRLPMADSAPEVELSDGGAIPVP